MLYGAGIMVIGLNTNLTIKTITELTMRLLTYVKSLWHKMPETGTRRVGTTVEEAGIWYCRKRQRYVAEITMNGKKVYQKTWKAEDIETAIAERKSKLIELGFHENHGS
jgi:hypothetical protein